MKRIECECNLHENNMHSRLHIENIHINSNNNHDINNNINTDEDEIHFYEHGAHFQYACLYDKLFHLCEKQKQYNECDIMGMKANCNQQSRNALKNTQHKPKEQIIDNVNEVSFHSIENNNNIDLKKDYPHNIIIKHIQPKPEKRSNLTLISKNIVHNKTKTNNSIKKGIVCNAKLTCSNRSSNCSGSRSISSKNKFKSVSENKRKQIITHGTSLQKRQNYSTSQHKSKYSNAFISPHNNNYTKCHSKLNTASLSNQKKTSPKQKSTITSSIIGSNSSCKQINNVKAYINKESKLKTKNAHSKKKILNGPAFSRNTKNKNVLKSNINIKNNNTLNQQSLTYNNNKINNNNNNNISKNDNVNIKENKENDIKSINYKKTSLKQKLLLFNNKIKQKPRSQEKLVKGIELNISGCSNKNESCSKMKNYCFGKNQSVNIHSSMSSRKNTSNNNNSIGNELEVKVHSKQIIKKRIVNNITAVHSVVQSQLSSASSKRISSRNGMNRPNARTITKIIGKEDKQKFNVLNQGAINKNKNGNGGDNRSNKNKKQIGQIECKTKCNSSSFNVNKKNKVCKK